MASITHEFCDVCGVELKHKADKMGLCVVVGYSVGGWGHRRNALNWSGEVCTTCYEHLGYRVAAHWRDLLKARQTAPQELPPPPPPARVVLKTWRDRALERIKRCLDNA